MKLTEDNSASVMRSAMRLYERDNRFRMIALSCTALALQEHGAVDPERADREAHDIALNACAMLLQRIYTEDAELFALRLERDHYKKLAEEGLKFAGPAPMLTLNGPQPAL